MARLFFRDRVKSSAIQEELQVEHVPPVGDSGEDPGHTGETMPLSWPGNTSKFLWKELDKVAGEREVWASLLSLLPLRAHSAKDGCVDDMIYPFLSSPTCRTIEKIRNQVKVSFQT